MAVLPAGAVETVDGGIKSDAGGATEEVRKEARDLGCVKGEGLGAFHLGKTTEQPRRPTDPAEIGIAEIRKDGEGNVREGRDHIPVKGATVETMQAGLKNPLLFLYLDPISTISAIKRGKSGSMLLPLQMMFAATKASEGLSLTVQSHQNSLRARLNIPHDLLKAIKSGMSGTTQGQ